MGAVVTTKEQKQHVHLFHSVVFRLTLVCCFMVIGLIIHMFDLFRVLAGPMTGDGAVKS